MKKLVSIIAAVAFIGSIANAELLKNFKYDGKIEVNAYNTTNDFDNGTEKTITDTESRVMLNASFDLNEDVNAVVSAVKNNRKYGTGSESAINNALDAFNFEQAYLNIKGLMGIDHKIGRQYYGTPGDLVIYYGPRMWPYDAGLIANAIDGWTGWYKNDKWDIHAIIAKEKDAGTVPNTDTDVNGINAKTTIDRFNVNAYFYQKVDESSGIDNKLDVIGARANWECHFIKGLNLGLEYDMNMGKDLKAGTDYKGYAYKLNADYSMDLMGKLGFTGEYVFESGDKATTADKDEKFTDIKADYRPGVIMGGGFGAPNMPTSSGYTLYNLGANWTPEKLNKLNIAVNYLDTSADKKGSLANKHLWTEMDLVATWTHSDNVSLKGYYARLTPEKKNNTTNDPQTMLGAAFVVKF